jgi:hypothetical protein
VTETELLRVNDDEELERVGVYDDGVERETDGVDEGR